MSERPVYQVYEEVGGWRMGRFFGIKHLSSDCDGCRHVFDKGEVIEVVKFANPGSEEILLCVPCFNRSGLRA
jgi:hypothetical protein